MNRANTANLTFSQVATNTSVGEKALENPAASTQSEARFLTASSDAARYQTYDMPTRSKSQYTLLTCHN